MNTTLIKRSLRGFLLISGAIFLITFLISQIIFPGLGLSPDAENEIVLPTGQILLALAVSIFMLFLSSTPAMVLFTGLVFGGSVSNFIESNFFGPVKDYIYVFSTGDLYCNVADLAIVYGVALFVVTGLYRWIKSGAPLKITLISARKDPKAGIIS